MDAFVSRHELSVDRVWHRGESRRRGGVQDESGFDLTAADVDSLDALGQEVSSFLEESRSMRASLAAAGAHAELHVGLMVYEVMPTSVRFSPRLLAALAREGIALEVTGYPCSEDDPDEHTT
ncbi:MAG: hypothetical protein ABW221_01400 [Vicinamibacteria bacterium]